MLPSDTDPVVLVTEADVFDTGFSGLPFDFQTYPTMNLIYLLLFAAWIGMMLLTAYAIRKNQPSTLPNLDSDTVIILTVWFGVLVLTGYVIRILHGP